MAEQAPLRNIERIQETDEASKTPKAVTAALVVLGGACVVFAAMALGGRHSTEPTAKVDPLGDLVSTKSKGGGAAGRHEGHRPLDERRHVPRHPQRRRQADDRARRGARQLARGRHRPRGRHAGRDGAGHLGSARAFGSPLGDAAPGAERPRRHAARDASARRPHARQPPTRPSSRRRRRRRPARVTTVATSSRSAPSGRSPRPTRSPISSAPAATSPTSSRPRSPAAAPGTACASAPSRASTPPRAYRTGFEQKEHVVPFVVPPATATK